MNMKKLIGLQAEVNITTDDDVAKAVGQALKGGALTVADIINAIKPDIARAIAGVIKGANKEG